MIIILRTHVRSRIRTDEEIADLLAECAASASLDTGRASDQNDDDADEKRTPALQEYQPLNVAQTALIDAFWTVQQEVEMLNELNLLTTDETESANNKVGLVTLAAILRILLVRFVSRSLLLHSGMCASRGPDANVAPPLCGFTCDRSEISSLGSRRQRELMKRCSRWSGSWRAFNSFAKDRVKSTRGVSIANRSSTYFEKSQKVSPRSSCLFWKIWALHLRWRCSLVRRQKGL